MAKGNLLRKTPISDEQLRNVTGGAVPIVPIIKIVVPIILPPIIEQIQKNMENTKGNPAVPNSDLNKYADPDAGPKDTYDTGDAVPNKDLNKYVEK